jgi:hypothetical protein
VCPLPLFALFDDLKNGGTVSTAPCAAAMLVVSSLTRAFLDHNPPPHRCWSCATLAAALRRLRQKLGRKPTLIARDSPRHCGKLRGQLPKE